MTSSGPGLLSTRIAEIVAIDPGAPALEFEGRWYRWGELGATVEAIAAQVGAPGDQVGIVLRNRPAHVGALLGVLRAGGCAVAINPSRGVERTRDDIAGLGLAGLVGTADDLDELVPASSGATRVAIDELGCEPEVDRSGPTDAEPAPARPGVAVRMLTSGTTGPPKRVDLTYETLERVLLGAKHYERDQQDRLRLRSGVAIVNSPLVHLGGLFRVLQCVNDGRSFCLLERFTVDGWVDAVRRHRPRTASLVPAALRMVLEADLDPAGLRSIRSVVSGTAPLSPERRRRLPGQVRHPGAGHLRRHRVRRQRGRLEPGGPPAVRGRPSGAAWDAPTPAASCASSTSRTAGCSSPTTRGCSR